MPKALILNHTGLDYHYGCFATSMALVAMLERDGYAVQTISVDMIAAVAQTPSAASDLTSKRFYDEFHDGNPAIASTLAGADIVVVNGEGTLHGMSRRARNLLYMVAISKHFHEKPTYLVNHSFLPTDYRSQQDAQAFAFYQSCAQYLDGAAARELRSHAIYRDMGIQCVQAFDMLPLFAQSHGIVRDDAADDNDAVVLGLGVGWPPDRAESLARVVKTVIPTARSVALLNGAPVREPPQEDAYPPLMAAVDTRMKTVFESSRAAGGDMESEARLWLSTIANASLLITGRYHHVIAALAMGTPVIGITSNTDKIESSISLLGVNPVIIDPREGNFEVAMHEAVSSVRSGRIKAMKTDAAQRERVLAYAAANRIWPVSTATA
jgi:polysaccharide pyruvyl transferase WcaK-like protein